MPKTWPTYEQKRIVWDQLGYQPFPLQERIHRSMARVLQIVGAEGSGKSYVTAMEIVAWVLWCELVYIVGEEYDYCQREFEYCRNALLELGLTDRTMINEPRIGSQRIRTSTNCRIETISLAKDSSGALIARGEQPDLIVLAEAGRIQSESVFHSAWQRISRSNGRILLSGTMQSDEGWYSELEDTLKQFNNDYAGETFSLPAWANEALYPGGRDNPHIRLLERTLPPDRFARTVAAEKMTSLAAIFGDLFDPHIHVRPCPFNPNVPVTVAIDPGYYPSAYAVVAMQQHADESWQIDEVYENYKTHYEIIDICKAKPWWPAVRRLVGDVAMNQHLADRSAAEVWLERTGMTVQGQRMRVQEGIDRHRALLHQQRLFHDPSCKNTIWEYKMYRRRVDKDGQPVSDLPLDKDNHAMKALAYYIVDRHGLSDYQPKTKGRRHYDPWARTMAPEGIGL